MDFTADELETLQFAPWWAFTLVAGVDGKIDGKETAAILKEVGESQLYRGTVIRDALAASNRDVAGAVEAYARDNRDVAEGLREAADILDRKVSPDEALKFKMSVLMISKNVAEASGPRFGKKISSEEEKAITLIGLLLRFDPTDLT